MHFQISTTVTRDNVEGLSDIFSELGALSISLSDAKDEPLFQLSPEDNPHWQHTTIHALFDSMVSADAIVEDIQNNHPKFSSCDFYIEKVKNKNWVVETQKQFHPQQFGKLWVCPQWEKENFSKLHKNSIVVYLEPGLAFGTGTHPTTQLCLTWLSENIPHANFNAHSNLSVIDYGCGSGILALAACALGAKNVYATDHDIQALESTRNNEKYNRFKTQLHIVNTTDIQSARAHIVVANILANPLIDLAPTLTKLLLPHGQLILSGILLEDADRVFAAYKNHFAQMNLQHQDGWVLMSLNLRG